MKRTRKRLGSMLLALCMVLSLLPATAFAAEGDADTTVDIGSVDASNVWQYNPAMKEIENAIDAAANNGGGTVTVEGSISNAESNIVLSIPDRVTVQWNATLSTGAKYVAWELIALITDGNQGGTFIVGENASLVLTADTDYERNISCVIDTNGVDVVVRGTVKSETVLDLAVIYGHVNNADVTLDGGNIIAKSTSDVAVKLDSGVFIHNSENGTVTGEVIDGGGHGTEEKPYEIGTEEDLAALAERVNSGDTDAAAGYYQLTDDIYLADLGRDWTPIDGNFTGVLDGDGYTIYGLSVPADPERVNTGLFGEIVGTATIKDLNVVIGEKGVHATSSAGGLVGVVNGSSTIQNVSVSGGPVSAKYAGGIVGQINGMSIIQQARSSVSVSASGRESGAGGIAGLNNGTIESSCNTGSVSATGDVSRAGGIVGLNMVSISQCWNSGAVTATGDGRTLAGGIAGRLEGTRGISMCYSAGSVSATEINVYTGGIVGGDDGATITASFFDSTVAPGLEVAGVQLHTKSYADSSGKTTGEMQTAKTFEDADWDFADIWQISSGEYPTLKNTQATYNPGDIAVINNIIENNGLNLTLADPGGFSIPGDWTGSVTWSKGMSNKRVTELSIHYREDSILTGALDVSELTALTDLDCYGNSLTKLNASGCSDLTYLECSRNQLTELDLSGCIALTDLDCSRNQLTELVLSGCTALTDLDCYENRLTKLNVSGCTSIENIMCFDNQLKTLDVSGCAHLSQLDCYDNQLTSLKIPSGLSILDCHQNRLTALNLAGFLLDDESTIDCSYNYLPSTSAITGITGIKWDDGEYTDFKFGPQHSGDYKAVTGIIGVPTSAVVGKPLTLAGTVIPVDATYQTIIWSIEDGIEDDDDTGATIEEGNIFTATAEGYASVLATIVNGKSDSEAYTYEFVIQVSVTGEYHTITFDANDGTVTLATAQTKTDGKLASLPNPTRSGYTFDGWFTAASGGTMITTNTPFVADATIYAQWTPTGGGTPSSSGGTPATPVTGGTVAVSYTAANGTASLALPTSTVNEIIAKAKDGAAVIDLSKASGVTAAELPKAALAAFDKAGLDVTLSLPAGTVTLDADAAASVAQQAAGANVSVELRQAASSALTGAQKEAVKTGDLVLDTSILSNGQKISTFDGTLTVSAPYTGPQPVAVWYLNDKGGLEKLSSTYADGAVTFTLHHLSLYVVGQDTAWVNPFTDVQEADWFYGAVQYAYEKDLMKGTGATTFDPHGVTTRGMIVAILYRLENSPVVSAVNPFTDVAAGKYYTDAVAWAAEHKLVGGYGDGRFGPEDAITREQLAAILMNYAGFKGYDVAARTNLSQFADAATVSGYAKDAMSWANAGGLIQGSGTNLMPTGSAQRAQVAAILQRFIEAHK